MLLSSTGPSTKTGHHDRPANKAPWSLLVPPMSRVFRPSRRRNSLVILFTLALIYLFVLYEFLLPHRLTLEEGSLGTWLLHDSDDDSFYSSSATIPHGNSTSRVLLVSSLFILSKSKHSKEEYHDWLQRFLGPVTTDVYFYTSPDLAPTVQAVRGEGLPITIDANYTTPFDVPPLKGQEGWYNKMHTMDRENSYHSPELYSVWNAKPFFVDNAVRVMASKGKTYDYVFWSDGGSFREINVYKNWPDPDRLDEVWYEGSRLSGTKAQDLLFYAIQYPPYNARDWKEDMGPIDTDFSEGEHSPHFVDLIFIHSCPRFILWWFSEHSSLVGTYILRLSRLLQQQKHLRRERSDRLQLPPRSIQQTYHHRMGKRPRSARSKYRARFRIPEIFISKLCFRVMRT